MPNNSPALRPHPAASPRFEAARYQTPPNPKPAVRAILSDLSRPW